MIFYIRDAAQNKLSQALNQNHAVYRDKFENEFFNIIIAVIKDFIKDACTRTYQEKIRIHQNQSLNSSRAATQQQYSVILSEIKLPIFDEIVDDY